MKKSIILICAALLGGCIEHAQSDNKQLKEPQQVGQISNDDRIKVWHDDQRRVTCWVYLGYKRGGLSCIPDSQLQVGSK